MSINLNSIQGNLKILTVPGLHGSGNGHWQTKWENLYGFSRIEQEDWDNPVFSHWAESLYKTLEEKRNDSRIVLVAHSMGCHLVVKSFPNIKNKVKGVFLVAPPDLKSEILQKDLTSFSMPHVTELGVPGYMIFSEDDPYASVAYSENYGKALELNFINIGKKGHINSDSNLGDWDEGAEYLKQLLKVISVL
jgi:predicted alpha/beta hydrolase family esterase